MVVTSPECVDPYTISDSCGVSASSALNEETLPGNVILDDDTFWAPAIRSGTSTCSKLKSVNIVLLKDWSWMEQLFEFLHEGKVQI